MLSRAFVWGRVATLVATWAGGGLSGSRGAGGGLTSGGSLAGLGRGRLLEVFLDHIVGDHDKGLTELTMKTRVNALQDGVELLLVVSWPAAA